MLPESPYNRVRPRRSGKPSTPRVWPEGDGPIFAMSGVLKVSKRLIVTHESYYPGSRDRVRPGMTHRVGGQVYTHYWRISPQVSELIRRGEEEHLADAQRAYELTYKLIADTINSMFGQRFGPAGSPAEADKLAAAELAKRLPKQLGTDPRNWVAVLDRLLGQTKERGRRGWHTTIVEPPQTIGNKIIHPVVMGPSARIGQVSTSQVVGY